MHHLHHPIFVNIEFSTLKFGHTSNICQVLGAQATLMPPICPKHNHHLGDLECKGLQLKPTLMEHIYPNQMWQRDALMSSKTLGLQRVQNLTQPMSSPPLSMKPYHWAQAKIPLQLCLSTLPCLMNGSQNRIVPTTEHLELPKNVNQLNQCLTKKNLIQRLSEVNEPVSSQENLLESGLSLISPALTLNQPIMRSRPSPYPLTSDTPSASSRIGRRTRSKQSPSLYATNKAWNSVSLDGLTLSLDKVSTSMQSTLSLQHHMQLTSIQKSSEMLSSLMVSQKQQ